MSPRQNRSGIECHTCRAENCFLPYMENFQNGIEELREAFSTANN